MSYFTKLYHPPGTPPGTLTESVGQSAAFTIRLIDYTEDQFQEQETVSAIDCQRSLSQPTCTWIHVQGQMDPAALRELGELFGLHPLALEDVLNVGQRPKAEIYDDQLFVIMSLAASNDHNARTEQVSLFFGTNFLISFHSGSVDPFEPVRKRLRPKNGRMRRRSTDYLLYALLDIAVDQGFPVLEVLGERLEDLEDELLERADDDTVRKLHGLKRELLLLRRMLWPHRDVLNLLLRDDHPDITAETRVYLRDCYDHAVQIMELLEFYREMTSSMFDVYLSTVSNRMNEVMRVLTVIATIFIPLTFVAGIYGMNFAGESDSPWAMPELRWAYGYPVLWLVMVGIAVGMLIYFKRRKWL